MLRTLTRFIEQWLPHIEAQRDVQDAVAGLDPGFQRHIEAVLASAQLTDAEAELRGAAVLFQIAAVQIADDIADEELQCLKLGPRHGAGTQAILQILSQRCLLQTTIPQAVQLAATSDLLELGATHLWELGIASWDIDAAKRAAKGMNGAQFRAYYRLLLAGTAWAPQAATLGEAFGIVLHVAGDRASHDERWLGLELAPRRALLAWASGYIDVALNCAHPPTLQQLSRLRALLDAPILEPAL